MKGYLKSIGFTLLVSFLLLFGCGVFLYLGSSVTDVFVLTYLVAFIVLSVGLYKFKQFDIGNFLYWKLFEFLGYGFFTLVLCLLTENLFHHFIFATTTLAVFFRIFPSVFFVLLFNKKTLND